MVTVPHPTVRRSGDDEHRIAAIVPALVAAGILLALAIGASLAVASVLDVLSWALAEH